MFKKIMEKVYLKNENSNPNAIYIYLKDTSNKEFVILKEIDTITDKIDILLEDKDSFVRNYYNIKRLINDNNLVNSSGYYKDMTIVEKAMYETFEVLYRDNNYELLYDLCSDRYLVNRCSYDKNSFVKTGAKDKKLKRIK